MLSLMSKWYTDEQYEALYEILVTGYGEFKRDYCEHVCKKCQYRRVCDDVERLIAYLIDKMNHKK